MIAVGVRPTDLARFDLELEAALLRVELALSGSFQKIVKQAFTMLVVNSPQWSGNFTSNWNYSVNTPDYSYDEILAKSDPDADRRPFERGRNPAVSRTLQKVANIGSLSWRDKVYITNATPDDAGGSLGSNMEAGTVRLRPVNLIDGKVALISYTVDFINRKT